MVSPGIPCETLGRDIGNAPTLFRATGQDVVPGLEDGLT
jgi:hypothetical protein